MHNRNLMFKHKRMGYYCHTTHRFLKEIAPLCVNFVEKEEKELGSVWKTVGLHRIFADEMTKGVNHWL